MTSFATSGVDDHSLGPAHAKACSSWHIMVHGFQCRCAHSPLLPRQQTIYSTLPAWILRRRSVRIGGCSSSRDRSDEGRLS